MRFATIQVVYEEMDRNKNLYFLSGDLAHVHYEDFQKRFPTRYSNVGISEQNLIGMGAGLALTGKKVVVYSIVPFITMRCFEQVKNDVCYQNLDVTLVGIGGGYDYGKYANTHCSIEDIAVMRVLPNMKVVAPANPYEATQLMQQLMKIKGPVYVRIGRGKEPMPTKEYPVTLGKGSIVREGKDVSIFIAGTILPQAEKAAELLQQQGIDAEIVSMHTIKPLDSELILNRSKNRKAIVTMEEHNIIGGLGGAIAEVLSEHGTNAVFKRFGAQDKYLKEIGSKEYLQKRHGIDAESVSNTIVKLLQ